MGWMGIFLGVIGMSALLGLVLLLYFRTSSYPLRSWFFPFLFIKLAAGIGLGLVYFYHYEAGDTLAYHHDAQFASDLAFQDFPGYVHLLFSGENGDVVSEMLYHDQPRALIMSKLLSIVYIFSFQNYWLASLFLSFFSFAGTWYLANYFLANHSFYKITVAVAFFLFPSVIFWSSGVLKESLMMGSMGFLIFFFLKAIENRKIYVIDWALSIVFIAIIWIFKYYYAAILLPVMMGLAAIKLSVPDHLLQRNKFVWIFSFLTITGIIVFMATFLHPNLRIERVLHVLVENYEHVSAISKPENTITFKNLTPDIGGILKSLPEAVIAGLYRPFIWESSSLFAAWIGIENLMLLIFSVLALFRIGRLLKTKDYLLIVAAIVFVLIMAALLSISTPNFGSLSRYKTGFMPFFLLMILDPGLGLIDKYLRRI
jgi:hypothetical protein